MPISEYENDEVEELYDIIVEILGEDGKGDTNTIILGDWNSVVGEESYRNIVGPHDLGRKNHGGQMLINFCERNGLIFTNTWFRKRKTLHMAGTRRSESILVGLHTSETSIQRQYGGCADTAWGRY
jgi:hypothetical protein